MNALQANVKVIDLPRVVVWYTPDGFPTVQTDADLIDGDGDLLLIANGWQYKIISVQQVTRVEIARTAERHEQLAVEMLEFDHEFPGRYES